MLGYYIDNYCLKHYHDLYIIYEDDLNEFLLNNSHVFFGYDFYGKEAKPNSILIMLPKTILKSKKHLKSFIKTKLLFYDTILEVIGDIDNEF